MIKTILNGVVQIAEGLALNNIEDRFLKEDMHDILPYIIKCRCGSELEHYKDIVESSRGFLMLAIYECGCGERHVFEVEYDFIDKGFYVVK